MAKSMLPILALGAAALFLMKKKGGPTNNAYGFPFGYGGGSPEAEDPGAQPNFLNWAHLKASDLTPLIKQNMEEELEARSGYSVLVISKHDDIEKRAWAEPAVRRAAYQYPGIIFVMADCSVSEQSAMNEAEDCEDAWKWFYGKLDQPSINEAKGFTDEGFFEDMLELLGQPTHPWPPVS